MLFTQLRDKQQVDSMATLASQGHGKALIAFLKQELDTVKNNLVDCTAEKVSGFQGHAKAVRGVIDMLERADVVAQKLK